MNISKTSLLIPAIALCGAALLPARAAQAQDTGLLPVRVKIGALLPTDSTTKDQAGDIIPAAELDVKIPRLFGGNTFASIGYQDRGGLRTVPLTISRTFGPKNPLKIVTGNPYFGLGAGVYFLNGDDGVGSSESKTTVGGFAQAGYQFPNPYFIEAKYQLVAQKADGLSANGLLLFVGRRF